MAEYQDYGFYTPEPSHVFAYLQAPLLSMLDKGKNTCILDIGCGNGYLANYLIAQGFNVYGTDASEQGIAIAQQANPERFFVQDLTNDELPAALQKIRFDTIICTEVIEHLYNPIHFIGICKNILGNSGEILVSTPYHGYLKNLMLSVINKWDAHISPLWVGGHIKLWSKNTLSRLLTDAGFTVTGFKGCGRVPYFWMTMLIKARIK